MPEPRHVTATRYVTPLREGGSLPGLVEADDDGLYVVKFRGAGQGPRALVAEWLAGEIGRALGLPVPEIVDDRRGRQSRRRRARSRSCRSSSMRSGGLNLGLDFLPGALTFNPGASPVVDPDAAAAIVWLDAFTTNPDRTAGNPNLLIWHGRTWLIDHGAALYVHHTWRDPDEHAERPFERTPRPRAAAVRRARSTRPMPAWRPRSTGVLFERLAAAIPDLWLPDDPTAGDAERQRAAYVRYLDRRLAGRRPFVEEAERARRAA